MKRLLILPMALILVSCVTSSCSSSSSKDKAQNDSIAAAELEAARLDSIRQDSIARRNFTSPDLKFHDLHGDVKKCVVDNNEYTTYTFDENGKWTNEPVWDEYDKKFCPDRTKHPRVIRNKDGYITRIYCECDADDQYEAFSWEDGKVKGEGSDVVLYDDYGFTIYSEFEGWCGKYPSIQTVYYDYIVDDMGNWVQSSYFSISWDPDYPDVISCDEGTTTRTITYYKSISQNRIALPNSAIQIQKLQELKATKQKKEQECPEWLQGNWSCQTQYGEARVGISGDIISVWFNGEHFYTGRFEVRKNELVYGRGNGSAYTLQFDRYRECLMMDDNHPMSRF